MLIHIYYIHTIFNIPVYLTYILLDHSPTYVIYALIKLMSIYRIINLIRRIDLGHLGQP